jgi:hypothetical protein
MLFLVETFSDDNIFNLLLEWKVITEGLLKLVMLYKVTLNIILFIVSIFFASTEFALAQPTLKEENRIKNFGKSLKKYDKKSEEDSQNKEKKSVATDADIIRVETNLVMNDVLVLNQKGNAILGLGKNDFVITEDGVLQEISIFSFGENAIVPRSIVLIFDTSNSLRPYLKNSLQAAKILVDKLAPQDRMAIVSSDVKLVVNFTRDKVLLKEGLDSLASKLFIGKAGLTHYDALLAVLNEMFDEEDIHPIVIFQTDGDEINGFKEINGLNVDKNAFPQLKRAKELHNKFYGLKNFGFSDVKESVEKSRATIYSIIPGIRFIGFSREEQLARAKISIEDMMKKIRMIQDKNSIADAVNNNLLLETETRILEQSALFEIAKLSGGYTDYLETPEDAENVYSTILTIINNRYVIGYYPTTEERNKKRRNVKIEVRNHPEYIVMGRKTYFVTSKEE